MTNILIPTDFTEASFKLAEKAIQSIKGKRLNIIFFHAFEMPDAFEMLDRSRKRPYQDLLTESFRQSCKQLKDLYPKQIQKICFNCMEGNTPSLFRNFAEANEIDFIVYPEQYRFIPVSKISVDPETLFKKSGITLIRDFNPTGHQLFVDEYEMLSPAYLVSN